MTLQNVLSELLARHNGDVLPITLHVIRNPLRIALLGADGNRYEYAVSNVGAREVDPMPEVTPQVTATVDEPATDGVPPPIRVTVQGFQDAMFYGRPAGE